MSTCVYCKYESKAIWIILGIAIVATVNSYNQSKNVPESLSKPESLGRNLIKSSVFVVADLDCCTEYLRGREASRGRVSIGPPHGAACIRIRESPSAQPLISHFPRPDPKPSVIVVTSLIIVTTASEGVNCPLNKAPTMLSVTLRPKSKLH